MIELRPLPYVGHNRRVGCALGLDRLLGAKLSQSCRRPGSADTSARKVEGTCLVLDMQNKVYKV